MKVLNLLLFFLLITNIIVSPDILGKSNSILKYQVISDLNKFTKDEEMNLWLSVENFSSTEIKCIKRVKTDDLEFKIKGPGNENYSIKWTFKKTSNDKDIYLKPNCQIKIYLGSFIINKRSENLKIGQYILNIKWRTSREKENNDLNSIILEYIEYPFIITIKSLPNMNYSNKKFELMVSLKNNGHDKIRILNFFYPYEQFFKIIIENLSTNKKEVNDGRNRVRSLLKAVTPLKREGWLYLLPNDEMQLNINIKNEFKNKGLYEIYLIYPKLIIIDDSNKVKYSSQKRWKSNKILLNIY